MFDPTLLTSSRLASYLVKKHVLSSRALQDSYPLALQKKIPIIHYLIQNQLVRSSEVLNYASELFHLAICDLSSYDFDNLPYHCLSVSLLREHIVLPLYDRTDHIVLAMADPSDNLAIENFHFLFSKPTVVTIADAAQLQIAVEHALQLKRQSDLHLSLEKIPNTDLSPNRLHYQTQIHDAPIVAYIHQLLQDAVDQKISDIHCEPYANEYRIRLRKDGFLVDYASPPSHIAPYLTSRMKVMADLNITERRLPQDGRFEFITRQGFSVDVRISVCPVIRGEKIVLRLLNVQSMMLSLDHLGLEAQQHEQLCSLLEQPSGLILITGPTGSGKTITLYSLLQYLNNGQRNISTIEDPVEIQLSGINQVAVQPAVGLDFSQALRCLLRQDPDIIMLGEIRDAETAMIACKTAQTGHLVLSSLHSHNAVSVLARMQQLGVNMNELANSLKLIVCQRLVRRLCKHCRTPYAEENSALSTLPHRIAEPVLIYKNCEHCHQGYEGRTGIFEFQMINEKWKKLMSNSVSYQKINQYARQQDSLEQMGLNKIKVGITDMNELQRVL